MIRTVAHVLEELSKTQKYKHKEIHNFKVKLLEPKKKRNIVFKRNTIIPMTDKRNNACQ